MTSLNELDYYLDYLIYKARGANSTQLSLKTKLQYIKDEDISPSKCLKAETDTSIVQNLCTVTGGTTITGNRWIKELSKIVGIYSRGGLSSVYAYAELSDTGSMSGNDFNAEYTDTLVGLLKHSTDEETNTILIETLLKEGITSYIIFNEEIFARVFKIPVEYLGRKYRLPCDSFILQLMLYTDKMITEQHLENKCVLHTSRPKFLRPLINVPEHAYTREQEEFYTINSELRGNFRSGAPEPWVMSDSDIKINQCKTQAKSKLAQRIKNQRRQEIAHYKALAKKEIQSLY